MRRLARLSLALAALAAAPHVGLAQDPPPDVVQLDGGPLRIEATTAYTWQTVGEDAVLLEGPVRLTIDKQPLTADAAVVWLAREGNATVARIAPLGRANLGENPAPPLIELPTRQVRLVAGNRVAADASESALYQEALRRRPALIELRPPPPYEPQRAVGETVSLAFENLDSRQTAEGTAFVLTGNVLVFARQATGTVIELQGERAVVYTTLENVEALATLPPEALAAAIEGVYLEGDVRISQTPPGAQIGGRGNGEPPVKLNASSAFYELKTDRAVLSDAKLRTTEPVLGLPVTVRAKELKQLAQGVFDAEQAELSTSRLARPEYGLGAGRLQLKQTESGVRFLADDLKLRLYGVPYFYLPAAGGALDKRTFPLERFGIESSENFGTGVLTRWGLFETLGREPPPGLDASYRLDYFTERGFGLGLDANYARSGLTDAGEPRSFSGRFTGYFVPSDSGQDDLARRRSDIDADGATRGRVLLEHNHFFAGDWQGQLRLGYASDATFVEEWFEREYRDGLPHNATAYLTRQDGTEQLSVLLQQPTGDYVTTSENVAEQFQLRKLPELGYFRVADGLGDKRTGGATFYSSNRVGLLAFDESNADPTGDQLGELGFRNASVAEINPSFRGLPSAGFTGISDDLELRGDFRQQLDFPVNLGRVRAVPYVVGRYTGYADSPDGGNVQRLLGGVGLRASTQFVRVDELASSKLFDMSRVRHIVEPGMHLFASVGTDDVDDVFVYDAETDGYSNLQAAQLSLRQRWQTKRGAEGLERSVDFFTLDVAATIFNDGPEELNAGVRGFLTAEAFRGILLDGQPENSVARDTISADALWRISDTTAVVGDVRHNLETSSLATASVGLAAQRGDRLSYYIGGRYLGEIHTTFGTVNATYQLGDKYTLTGLYAFDFTGGESRAFDIGVLRDFERYFVSVRFFYDQVNDEGGVRLAITPKGLGLGFDTGDLADAFGGR
jgi:hypothetical protein